MKRESPDEIWSRLQFSMSEQQYHNNNNNNNNNNTRESDPRSYEVNFKQLQIRPRKNSEATTGSTVHSYDLYHIHNNNDNNNNNNLWNIL